MDDLVTKANIVDNRMVYGSMDSNNPKGNTLELAVVALNRDKGIYLIRAFEIDEKAKKKYIRNAGILVQNTLLTSTFADTIHFMEELFLFDTGNDQNKYLSISEYKNTKNLKLVVDGNVNVFVSKSEARAMYKLFNLSLMGYSTSRVLEFEHRFTPEDLTMLLHKHNLLENKR